MNTTTSQVFSSARQEFRFAHCLFLNGGQNRLVTIGVEPSDLGWLFPARSPQSFIPLRRGIPGTGKPRTLSLVIGPELSKVDPSLMDVPLGFVSGNRSLTTLVARIDERVWSSALVDRLPILPPTLRIFKLYIRDLQRPDGTDLVRLFFKANSSPDAPPTVNLNATISTHEVQWAGYLSDIPLILSFVVLCKDLTVENLKTNVRTKRTAQGMKRSVSLRTSGSLTDARKVVQALTNMRQFTAYSLLEVQSDADVLRAPDESTRFVHALVARAPSLRKLSIEVQAMHQNEIYTWMYINDIGRLQMLEEVFIEHPRALPLIDATVVSFLMTWKHIQLLSLNPKPSLGLITGQASLSTTVLEGIAARAPASLTRLRLLVDPMRPHEQGMYRPTAHLGVRMIKVRVAGTRDEKAIAQPPVDRLARRCFPNATLV